MAGGALEFAKGKIQADDKMVLLSLLAEDG
jgi:hypothetical protein